jgi:protein-L-isoaspartate O-methyltransferase
VSDDLERRIRKLTHGDTIHGYESQDPVLAGEPLSYYHRTGPVGDAMRAIESRPPQHVGVVGLGTGSMAAYADSRRRVTFFDVDPQMVDIARGYFSYLNRCGASCTIVLGDGRLKIGQVAAGEFDVLMLDAFNSDSIPPHLVSREAIRIYLGKLKPDGMILFHVSSRYLNVSRLVAAVVTDAGLPAYIREDNDESAMGKLASTYVAVGRSAVSLGEIPKMDGWKKLSEETELRPWTDDYSNMLALIPPIEWRRELHALAPNLFPSDESKRWETE